MPRFRHALTGVVINVDDEYAARLGSEFTPADEADTEGATDPEAPADGSEDEAAAAKRRPRR